jgi:hypothetical protein
MGFRGNAPAGPAARVLFPTTAREKAVVSSGAMRVEPRGSGPVILSSAEDRLFCAAR